MIKYQLLGFYSFYPDWKLHPLIQYLFKNWKLFRDSNYYGLNKAVVSNTEHSEEFDLQKCLTQTFEF